MPLTLGRSVSPFGFSTSQGRRFQTSMAFVGATFISSSKMYNVDVCSAFPTGCDKYLEPAQMQINTHLNVVAKRMFRKNRKG